MTLFQCHQQHWLWLDLTAVDAKHTNFRIAMNCALVCCFYAGILYNGCPFSLRSRICWASLTWRPSTSNETTPVPCAPRAVLPALLMYSEGSRGKSNMTTCSIMDVSIPREARSVATKIMLLCCAESLLRNACMTQQGKCRAGMVKRTASYSNDYPSYP